MQSAAERAAISHYLAKHGLGRLDDLGLMAQLGYLIDNDQEFSRLLNVCDPANRREMYEALKPNLRFAARLLDEYVSEWREQAEVRQLPVVGPDGTLRAYNVPEINTVLAEAVAKYHLIIVCRRCTREASFPGTDRYECVLAARVAGWIYTHGEQSEGYEICPQCADDLYPKGEL